MIFIHVYKGYNMFLCKQQIFSPGLLTRPVLIMSVSEDKNGGGRETNYFSFLLALFLFCPKPFFFIHAAICQKKEVNCVNIAEWKDASFTFIQTQTMSSNKAIYQIIF